MKQGAHAKTTKAPAPAPHSRAKPNVVAKGKGNKTARDAVPTTAITLPSPMAKFQLPTDTGVPISIHLTELMDCFYAIFHQNKLTPLIVDPSGRVDTFCQYSEKILAVDVRPYVASVDLQKTRTHADAKEELRKKLLKAMKYGYILSFLLMESAFLVERYMDESHFPAVLFERGGLGLHEEAVYGKLLRDTDEADVREGNFEVHPDFRVMVTTQFQPGEYQEYLCECLPLAKFQAVHVRSDE